MSQKFQVIIVVVIGFLIWDLQFFKFNKFDIRIKLGKFSRNKKQLQSIKAKMSSY
jgi:hypothetical protein